MELLLSELRSASPTCRRGEGFADRLEVGDGQLRGRAVPYGVTVELAPGLREVFRPGAFSRQARDPSRVKLCLSHGEVIGKVHELREEPDGLYFAAAVSTREHIPEARKALDLLADDLVDELSIGFNTVKGGTSYSSEGAGTLATHHRARLFEVSLVPWGAYGRGAVLQRSTLVDLAAEVLAAHQNEAREWLANYTRGGIR